MISIEIAVPGNHRLPIFEGMSLKSDVELNALSDRSPSLWNDQIRTMKSWTMIHLLDRNMRNQNSSRWIYDDLEHKNWPRIKLAADLESDLFLILESCINLSDTGAVLFMVDYQFGPKAINYRPTTLPAFVSRYEKYGLRLNSAVSIRSKNSKGSSSIFNEARL